VPVLVGAIGDDERGERLTALCRNAGIETRFVADRRPTTAKLRHIAQNQQLLRVDWEACAPLDGRGLAAAVDEVTEESGPETVTVVSDYAKGAVTPALAAALRERPGRVIVDPRPAQRELYRGFYLMTPNHREAAAISGTEETEHPPRRAAARITDAFTENVLITCGGRGMLLRQADGRSFDLAARARQVYDITGAGDTVAAVTALALAAGLELLEAAALANHAAGVVVGKVGTATATPEEVRDHLMQTPEETP
jgi:D-beta-D-heptose 7-phosphate kinase/D-beta-D-heptose 1-phosphate adenosyltransferase